MKKLSAILILVFTGFFLFATERLIVNNVEVKDFKNPTDILGDGTVLFFPDSSTLTLNNATLTKGADGKGLECLYVWQKPWRCPDDGQKWSPVLYPGSRPLRRQF